MRNDFDHFTRTMESLEKYKDHINRDVMDLLHLDRTSPLGLRAEELQAAKISSNSLASKRKRHEEYLRAVRLYIIEQDEIRSLIDIYKMEQQRQAELDEENDAHSREEKGRLKQYELSARPHSDEGDNPEIKKFLELLKQLESEISKCLLRIEKYIAQLEEFVTKLKEDIKEQRKQFLEQFYENVKKILLSLCVQNGDRFEVHAGTQKVPVDIEKMAKTISDIMQKKFENHKIFDQNEFKADVQEVLVNTLFKSAYVPTKKIEKMAGKIANEIVRKQADFCEAALRADQIQVQRVEWLEDISVVAKQRVLNLTHLEKEMLHCSPDKNSQKELESKMELVNEIKQQVDELEKKVDFVKEERTSKAMAMRNRRMRYLAEDANPAPSQDNVLKPNSAA
ncbi:MAG TPA: hypothetical protein VLJ15_00165 [Gammaproteobacteria bacterium]|nr:hypothetical protein [Gammaproteobacteria bacterium]